MITLPLNMNGVPIPATYPPLRAGIAERKAMTQVLETAKPHLQAAITGIIGGGFVALVVLVLMGVIP